MTLAKSSVAIIALLMSVAAQAQMYKWVGPDGKVNYTDTPPPKSAKSVEQKNLSGDAVDTSSLPYELAEAVKNNPVTLYTTSDCTPCDDGRSHLNKRGVPFREKTVSNADDLSKMTQATGSKQFPVLLIGRGKQFGYSASAWDAALTTGGYPEVSRLPKTYRNGSVESAAPAKSKPAENKSAVESVPQRTESLPSPTGNAPPGFRF